MNKKTAPVLSVLLIMLFVLGIISGTIVSIHLVGMAAQPERDMISLTEGMEGSDVTVSDGLSCRMPSCSASVLVCRPQALAPTQLSESGSFEAYDSEKVWTVNTDIEIFRATYDNNGDMQFTVVSGNGDSVIAPGTGGEYRFALRNTKTYALDYTLTAEAYFKGEKNLWIPVEVKMTNDSGYMVGTEDSWEDVMDLNTVSESGVIAAGNIKDYTLQWQWPFERGTGGALTANDRYDTSLGNEAVGKGLELHIIFRTTAQADDDPDHPGGHPSGTKTGDDSNAALWIFAEIACLAAIIFAVIQKKKLDAVERGKCE